MIYFLIYLIYKGLFISDNYWIKIFIIFGLVLVGLIIISLLIGILHYIWWVIACYEF